MTAIGMYQYIYLSNVVEHSLNSNNSPGSSRQEVKMLAIEFFFSQYLLLCMALFYGQNIKFKYISVMLYISMLCCIHQCYVCIYQYHVVYINVMFMYINVMLYTSMLCLYISMSCCIHQCYIKGVYISFLRCKSSFKCHKSMLSVIHLSCNVASRSDIIRFV